MPQTSEQNTTLCDRDLNLSLEEAIFYFSLFKKL